MPDPTTLATKIVRALWPSEFREQVLDARIATVRGVLEREGLSDLEAKLEAKERELEEARGRLERLASVARYVRSGIDHTESRTECRACALKSVLEELGLATEKED